MGGFALRSRNSWKMHHLDTTQKVDAMMTDYCTNTIQSLHKSYEPASASKRKAGT